MIVIKERPNQFKPVQAHQTSSGRPDMIKRGKLERIENLDQKRAANDIYFRVLVWTDAGWQNLLLTKHQVDTAMDRAKKNPEDETQPSWLDKII